MYLAWNWHRGFRSCLRPPDAWAGSEGNLVASFRAQLDAVARDWRWAKATTTRFDTELACAELVTGRMTIAWIKVIHHADGSEEMVVAPILGGEGQ